MTYLARTHRRYVRPRKTGLSGWIDDLANQAGNQQNTACLEQANAAVAPFDAKIDELAKTWTPTGFYRPQDLRDMVSYTMKLVTQAQAILDQAAAEPNASQDSIMRATDDLARAGAPSTTCRPRTPPTSRALPPSTPRGSSAGSRTRWPPHRRRW